MVARAPVTASTFWRRAKCPGSYAMERRVPTLPPSEAAAIGTMLHAYLEHQTPLDQVPEEYRTAIAYARDTEEQIRRDAGKGCREYREKELTSGTMDYLCRVDWLLVGSKRAWVIDYKFGRNLAEDGDPANNHQLALQAYGVRVCYPKCESVTAVLCYPLLRHTTAPVEYTDEDIANVANLYHKTRKLCLSERPVTNLGAWCLYCPGKIVCGEFAKMVMNMEEQWKKRVN